MLRVVTWNVLADAYCRREYYPNTPPSILDRAGRRRAVADRLDTFSPKGLGAKPDAQAVDILCLQEVDVALFALIEERLRDDATGRHFRKRGKGEGCAIFVRHALTTDPSWKEHVFSDKSGHVALGLTFAGITVVCTHLKWEPPGTLPPAHRGRAQLAEIFDTWPTGSRIVCGDLQEDPTSEMIATFAGERGFKDSHASMPDAFTSNANGQKKRIDYILCSSDFTSITPVPLARVVEDDTPLPGEDEPSDHVPLEAHLDRS